MNFVAGGGRESSYQRFVAASRERGSDPTRRDPQSEPQIIGDIESQASKSEPPPTDGAALASLETLPPDRFADWPSADVPGGPGIYTIWRGTEFLYVGIAGRPAIGAVASGTSKGLRGRLDSHASGRRSGDQFCIYICDRLVLPTLQNRLAEVANGSLSLDALTRAFVHEQLSYRFVATTDYAQAMRLESSIKRYGLPQAGRPLLNPGSMPD
jgi:hypothetical protein